MTRGVPLARLLATALPLTNAILPTAIVQINNVPLLASQASFGAPVPSYHDRTALAMSVAFPPDDNPSLCQEAERSDATTIGASQVVMVVPRGSCSFQRKARTAQTMGATAVIVYGSLSSRYGYNATTSTMEWPQNKVDYDCDLGMAFLPSDVLDFTNGYDARRNDGRLSGTTSNLCVPYGGADPNRCDSHKCLVTGETTTTTTTTSQQVVHYQACCAWDLHIWLYGDSNEEAVTIPAVYITMEEADLLMDLVYGASETITVSLYQRYVPKYNVSAVLIWALGVFVAWMASYSSSGDYRRIWKGVTKRHTRSVVATRPSSSAVMSSGVYRVPVEQTMTLDPDSTSTVDPDSDPHSDPNSTITVDPDSDPHSDPHSDPDSTITVDPESVELTAQHALGFIVMSSTSLLVLFFFKIYNIVKIMYAIGCSGALMQMVVHPCFWWMFTKLRWDMPLRPMEWLSEEHATRARGWKGKLLMCLWDVTGPIAPVDLMAFCVSYGLGALWLVVAFTIPHPDTLPFYWMMQDIFGTCMCILFLSTIKLNSVKVAAILLTVAFFYDIFFVFVTPLLTKHGESIMVNVATTGGPPKADPSWCEKYPHDDDCKGGDPLPMLFAIPRIGDYQGGCSMLGLGDIVLPGLLLSFASRYDEAKRLIGLIGGGSGRMRSNACPDVLEHKSTNPLCMICCCCRNGYFGPVMVAYAIGLAMANTAVYVMQMGQPALLYLVPCCLGTIIYIGHKAGELSDLWDGPRVIRAADRLLYGEPVVESGDDRRETSSTSEHDVSMTNESEAELT